MNVQEYVVRNKHTGVSLLRANLLKPKLYWYIFNTYSRISTSETQMKTCILNYLARTYRRAMLLERDILMKPKFGIVRNLDWNSSGRLEIWMRQFTNQSSSDPSDLIKSLTTCNRERMATPVPLNRYHRPMHSPSVHIRATFAIPASTFNVRSDFNKHQSAVH